MENKNDENISFLILDDPNNNNNTFNIEQQNGYIFNTNDVSADDYIYNDFHDSDIFNIFDSDTLMSRSINYEKNFTVKELMLICEYYGLSKDLKNSKANKSIIINTLMNYESNPINYDKVTTRERMWFYINELKNDKYMKKYILW